MEQNIRESDEGTRRGKFEKMWRAGRSDDEPALAGAMWNLHRSEDNLLSDAGISLVRSFELPINRLRGATRAPTPCPVCNLTTRGRAVTDPIPPPNRWENRPSGWRRRKSRARFPERNHGSLLPLNPACGGYDQGTSREKHQDASAILLAIM